MADGRAPNATPQRERAGARGALRKVAHLLLVVFGWAGFVWMWSLVASRPWDSRGLVWLIVGSLVVMPLLTGAWVLHNRALARRKGERRSVASVDMGYEHDWHGRRVHADFGALRASRLVLIQVEGEDKRYHGLRADAPRAAGAAPAPTRPGALHDAPMK
ncbi:MAG TPA: hypothetical protein PLO07_07610 [Rubrivivax sp.]|nr:hypothetical protein [Rubrivivax sp.]